MSDEDQVVSSVAPTEMVAPIEKMVSQSEVNAIVGRVRQEATEKARREAVTTPTQGTNITEEQVRTIAIEAAMQAQRGQAQALESHTIATSFINKMKAGEEKYPGLLEKAANADIAKMGSLVRLVNDVDNTADVLNDLLENGGKIGQIQSLINAGALGLASNEIAKLSRSIVDNQKAIAPVVKDPLSQVKPSAIIGGDSGKQTLSDFKKMFKN